MDDDLGCFCRQNEECPDHSKRGHGNLSVCMRYGRRQRRLPYCRTCKGRFSVRKGTPPFDSRLPQQEVVEVLQHVAEGAGVRKTSRLVGVSKDAVVRYGLRAGEHARQLHDELVAFSPNTREVRFDEKWAFVAQKEKHCDRDDPDDDRYGDCWGHVAIDPQHRLAVSAAAGRHAAGHADVLAADFRRRAGGRLMDLMTGGENPAYVEAVLHSLWGGTPATAARPTGAEAGTTPTSPEGLPCAAVHKTREKNRVVKVGQRLAFGTLLALAAALVASAVSAVVNTVFVERYNGTDRNRNARKARKTYCFSRDWGVHEAVSCLTLYSYNFCRAVRTPRVTDAAGKWQARTPAMAAGLTIIHGL